MKDPTQPSKEPSKPPAGLKWRSHPTFILTTVAMGLFGDLFLYNLIIPVLPFMLEDGLDIPPSQRQSCTSLMLAVYAGSNVVCCPLTGYLAEKLPTRRASFLLAQCCLFVATIMLFLGRSIAVLMVARALQGMSTAFVWTNGLSMCIETVGVLSMGKTMGVIFSVIAVASPSAPVIGGMLYRGAGLEAVMAVAVAVIGIDFVLRLLVIETKVAAKDFDKTGSFRRWTEAGVDPEQQPLLDRRKPDNAQTNSSDKNPQSAWVRALVLCLTDKIMLTALLGSLMQATLMGTFDSTIAVVAHELFDFDAFQAGIMFLPMGITNIISGPIVGWLIDRHGTRLAAVLSFGLLVPVLLLLRFVHTGGLSQILFYAGLLTLAGFGLAGSGTPSIVEVGAVVDRYQKANPELFGERGPYAMVYGMNGMVFNAGLGIGPELAAGLKEWIGFGNMNLVLAIASGSTACLCYCHLGGKPEAWTETARN
ncbi:hypothetical protein M409DRAFT_66881 [Zasmidium cellare ATCC 36951]|uniref:Major facilitator superfamily (MFS) profile domain-containing protein n=1 Tax=Zasmidium cellare ATCC 36951 TaxID=1080233 RepID=A0A6A6CKI9_ZASCE|nr:uncharacterized protein M409DRAFT_66881 [Zasmidium cellare ATCC 36951]KAF2165936.1 hypothetical protein M409DRAFT_66881 [Zasmidium cellare ATCC 36951]